MINNAQNVFTAGHILMGIILVLAPVKSDNIDIIIRKNIDIRRTISASWECKSPKSIINKLSKPMKIKKIPSEIHSIIMINLLSLLISPNPRTIFLVGIICAIPQIVISMDEM